MRPSPRPQPITDSDRAGSEYAARHADEITAGMERARAVLASDDVAIAAYLLDEPGDAIERVADTQSASADS